MPESPVGATPIFGHERTPDSTSNASNTSYILVETRGPLTAQEQEDLMTLGVEFLELLGRGVYLCRYVPENLGVIRERPYVKHVDIYSPHFKIHARTQQSQPAFDISGSSASAAPDAQPPQEKSNIVVILHQKLGKSASEVAEELISQGLLDSADTQVTDTQISALVEPAKLAAIAENDSVRSIEPEKEMQWRDDRARSILNAVTYKSDNVNPAIRFTGKGQIIAITDSGFDKGTVGEGLHEAFSKERILAFYRGDTEISLEYNAESMKDTSGHGTHCIGCAAGGPIQLQVDGPIISGTAPEADLIIGIKDNGLGHSDRYLQSPYQKGARIFSMSWGPTYTAPPQTEYDANATAIDTFINANKEALVCWAAGNDGTVGDKPQIISQAAAKNVLTVGNSNSERPTMNTTTKTIIDTDPTENPYVVDATSSRGLTAEFRIKPDVVAPGMRILAARSGAWEESKSAARDAYKDDSGKLFAMSGTSQATPLAAGCVALLRQALTDVPGSNVPSAALLRALIVNGAVQLTPGTKQQYNRTEGFGRLNLVASLAHINAPEGFAGYEDIEISHGDTYRIKAGKETRYGNVEAPCKGEPQKPPPDAAEVNNVQRLDWYDVPAKEAEIRVRFTEDAQKEGKWPCAVVKHAKAPDLHPVLERVSMQKKMIAPREQGMKPW
ncbi:hypothetical protein FH972_026534 [Carpinus fangiana]|uniref:Peptidase S8/S53 domain-containing protein n=1 Tax=Carpinus fangiana TaxID=176857 RepID=A0A5N6L492_9ROSI|nr:hypothetical protein FH972_026534 [Carpinus fangiana]